LFQEQKWCCAQQTAKYYRHGVLPLPKMMTRWLDKFRQCQPGSSSSSSKQPAGWVFVSTRGVAYKPGTVLFVYQQTSPMLLSGAWTNFVKTSFQKHSQSGKAPNGNVAVCCSGAV